MKEKFADNLHLSLQGVSLVVIMSLLTVIFAIGCHPIPPENRATTRNDATLDSSDCKKLIEGWRSDSLNCHGGRSLVVAEKITTQCGYSYKSVAEIREILGTPDDTHISNDSNYTWIYNLGLPCTDHRDPERDGCWLMVFVTSNQVPESWRSHIVCS